MKKHHTIVIAIAASLLCLTGCGKEESSVRQTDTALVLGLHANQTIPSVNDIAPYLEETCEMGGGLFTIRTDGKPEKMTTTSFDAVRIIGKKDSVLSTRTTEALKTAAKECQPASNGNNPLEAVNIAADCLRTNGSEDHAKKLVVYDTMLSDCAPLDMTTLSAMSDLDVDATVQSLEEQKQLPQLNGMQVVCILAPTTAPQAELSSQDWDCVQQLWTEIFRAGGADDIQFVQAQDSLDSANQTEFIVNPVATTAEQNSVHFVLNSDAVSFQDNSAQLIDESAAQEHINSVAQQLIKSGQHVVICGNTASGNDAGKARKLSKQRAQVVAEQLVASGVSASQIDKVIGLGYEGPFTENDIDEAGNQIESIAKNNRTVVIESVSSKIGKQIIAGKWEYDS